MERETIQLAPDVEEYDQYRRPLASVDVTGAMINAAFVRYDYAQVASTRRT